MIADPIMIATNRLPLLCDRATPIVTVTEILACIERFTYLRAYLLDWMDHPAYDIGLTIPFRYST